MQPSLAKSQIRTALILWAALVVAGVFWFRALPGEKTPRHFQTEYYNLTARDPNDPLRSVKLLAEAAQDLFPWVVFLPGIVALGWNLRFERNSWFKSLPVHAACDFVLAVAAGQMAPRLPTRTLPPVLAQLPAPNPGETGGAPHGNPGLELDRTRASLQFLYRHSEIAIYWLVVAATQAVYYSCHARSRELRALELSSKLTEARLEALRGQLQPHFMFNPLNAVSALIPMNPPAAQEALNSLAELLRASLNISDRQQIRLGEELDFLNNYMEIQKLRFGDRLNLKLEVQPGVVDSLIPPLFLQPLVENSIKHGLGGGAATICVQASAARDAGDLSVLVQDNGPESEHGVSNGVGLENLKRRLEALYPGNHRLTTTPIPGGGFRVALQIPFRTGSPRNDQDNHSG